MHQVMQSFLVAEPLGFEPTGGERAPKIQVANSIDRESSLCPQICRSVPPDVPPIGIDTNEICMTISTKQNNHSL